MSVSGLTIASLDRHTSIPAVSVSTDWSWRVVAAEDMADLREDWRALARRIDLPAIAGPEWTSCFHQSLDTADGLCLHVLSRSGLLAAVMPLRRRAGLRSTWASPAHAHLPSWTCAVDLAVPGIAEEILTHLLASAGALDLEPISGEDPLYTALHDAARARGLGVVLSPRHPEAIIDLVAPWERFCATMPAGIKHQMQKMRQLEKLGRLTFAKAGDVGEPPGQLLEECFELEAAGWKGDRGVPMRAQADTRAFYEALVRDTAATGSLALYTLRLDGRLIAFDLGVQSGPRVDGLKTSYAQDLARHSPGSLLWVMILRREVEAGVVRARHLGPAQEWKARWTAHVAPQYALRIHARGLLATAAYGTIPVVQQRLRQSVRARQVARATQRATADFTAAARSLRRRLRAAARQGLLTARWLARRESLVVLRKALASPPAVAPHWELEELGDAPEAVTQVYAALGRPVPDAALRRRCGTGQRFFVLRDGGRIVATTFVVAGGERFFDECAQGLAVPDASFWVRDVYVVPDRRGQRLFGTLLDVLIVRRFPATRAVLSDVRSDDPVSLRAHRHHGFEVCGAVGSWHVASRVMWRSSRVPSLRPATAFAPGQRLFTTGAAFRSFSEAHSA
jgi:CelD/BcsL family acetyltransferase involved in cellulose biosynthesis